MEVGVSCVYTVLVFFFVSVNGQLHSEHHNIPQSTICNNYCWAVVFSVWTSMYFLNNTASWSYYPWSDKQTIIQITSFENCFTYLMNFLFIVLTGNTCLSSTDKLRPELPNGYQIPFNARYVNYTACNTHFSAASHA